MKATKSNLIECLDSIGWSVRSHGADYLFIYNYEGENAHWVIFSDRVFLYDFVGDFDLTPSCAFYFDECQLEWVDEAKSSISLVPNNTERKGVYLMFSNHDMKRKVKEEQQ